MIGDLCSLSELSGEYEDEIYRNKVVDLSKTYSSIRRTRGDGNCFFRAFLYAYYEHLLTHQEEYKR